jgi:hypothetical protein
MSSCCQRCHDQIGARLEFTVQTMVRSYEHHRSSFRQVLLVELVMALLSDSLFSFPLFSVFMHTALLPLNTYPFHRVSLSCLSRYCSVVIPSVILFVLFPETTSQIVLNLSRAIESCYIVFFFSFHRGKLYS